MAGHFEPHVLVFGASVFMLGVHARTGAVDPAGPAWETAFHRFAEVSVGIGVALILTVVWPEREDTPWRRS